MILVRQCRSWRFRVVTGHDGHDRPGACRECWAPCVATIPKNAWRAGQRRCDDCEMSLLHCPMPSVRHALIRDRHTTPDTLRALATDPSGAVAMAAEAELARRRRLSGEAIEPEVIALASRIRPHSGKVH